MQEGPPAAAGPPRRVATLARMRPLRRLAATVTSATALAAVALLAAAARPRPVPRGPASAWTPDPPAGLPPGRVVAVPGHGEQFLREAPGPRPEGDAPVPTVLLVHGWMYPADPTWFTAYAPLSRVARVLAVDLRGHGRGSRPAPPFRLEDVADDLAALLDVLDTGPVIAVGYSLGGPVTQLLWRRHPQAVAGLVQCATAAAFSDSLRNRLVWRGMGLLQVALRVLPRHWLLALAVAQVEGRSPLPISRMLAADIDESIVPLLPWLLGEFDRDSAEDVAEAGRELGRYDARGWLGELDVPSAVLVTERDVLIPAEEQRQLIDLLPDPAVYSLPYDHNVALAAPEAFGEALVAAVQHVATAAGVDAATAAARRR